MVVSLSEFYQCYGYNIDSRRLLRVIFIRSTDNTAQASKAGRNGLEPQGLLSRMIKIPVNICFINLPREAREAIPWRRLAEILLVDFVVITLIAIAFLPPFSVAIADAFTIMRLVFGLAFAVLLASYFIRCITLSILFDHNYRKLRSLESVTFNENFRSALEETYRLELKPFLTAYFMLYFLYIWQLFQLYPLNEITLIFSLDISTLLRVLSPLIIPFITNLLASEGEYKGIRKTVLPEFFVYGVSTAQGKLVLSAFAKNSSPLEFIVEGEKYSIPPNEQGRVILSYRGSRVLRGQRITILPQKTLELEYTLNQHHKLVTTASGEKEVVSH